jgi:protein TonB
MTKGGRKRPDLKIASEAKQDRADDLLGAVVPSRGRDDPAIVLPPEADLSNVVAIARRPRKAGDAETPSLEVSAAERPAPYGLSPERQRQIALLIGASLLVHGAIFAAFNREPEPHASIGMISVSAEIVLGAQSNAGQSSRPSESEITSPAAPKTDEPVDAQPEAARKNISKNPDDPEQTKDSDTAAPKSDQALSAQTPEQPEAELVTEPKPAEKPTLTKRLQDAAKKLRETARHAKDDGENTRDRKAPASTPSAASNSVGRGRSDLDTNYRGIVSAHLARFKQMPSDAPRGSQGIATVSFSLSGGGSVTSARLVRGSGVASVDREAAAMVRRASPFPAPPSGRAQSFTVPVSFHMR